MRYTLVFLIGIFVSFSALSTDAHLTLEQQILLVKEYLKTVQHPRLILGVGNTKELSGNPSANPFLDNPNDILVNDQQKPGVLLSRSLTVNFNDVTQLNQLANAFPDTFDVITTDYLVTKYADWTKDHLTAFKRMLKPGGVLFLPIDANSNRLIAIKADTVEDLFEQASKQDNLQNSTKLLINDRQWNFANLPTNIDIPVDAQMEKEINETIEKYKKARPLVNDWISKGMSTRYAATEPLRNELSKIGIAPNVLPSLIGNVEMLNNDQRLASFIRQQVLAPHRSIIQNQLTDQFMEKYVIPLNLKHILGEVFNPQDIIIQKNLALPQPHREPTFSGYSISAKK